jgi:glycosyltransferase involved in cell wall biosynthesis
MIKIAYYVNLWDYAGTARSHKRINEALNRKEFEPFVICWEKEYEMPLSRIRLLEEKVGADHVVKISRPDDIAACTMENTSFLSAMNQIQPDILHIARSGETGWPLIMRYGKAIVIETNIFGRMDRSGMIDRTICISHYCAARRGQCDAIIYNMIPVATPSETYKWELRKELDIPNNAIVFGRIGSAHGHVEFSLRLFDLANTACGNHFYYLIVNPDDKTKKQAVNLMNIAIFEPTIDDHWIDRFFNVLDVFLHYRSNGEICGCAIQEAMMRGVPVLGHITEQDNGQIEVIGNGGMVAVTESEYVKNILYLANNYQIRKHFAANARAIALRDYAQDKLINVVEDCYKSWMQ